jgi:hypothetical protein
LSGELSYGKFRYMRKCVKCGHRAPDSEWKPLESGEGFVSAMLAVPRMAIVGLPAMIWNSTASGYRNLSGRKSRKGGLCPSCNAMHVMCPDCQTLHYVRASELGTKLRCRSSDCRTDFYYVPTGA